MVLQISIYLGHAICIVKLHLFHDTSISFTIAALGIDEVYDDWRDSTTESSWRHCFEVISTFSVVEDIEIRRECILSTSCLFPLFILENVISFVINLKHGSLLGSDDDFRLLARAFPKLKKLVVSEGPSSSSGRTLACLYHFSQECPDLREIRICLSSNASNNLDAIKKIPHAKVRNNRHPLEKIIVHSRFGQLEPTQLIQIAQFLDLIFPSLSWISYIIEIANWAADISYMTEIANWTAIYQFRLALRDANAFSAI